MREPMRITRGVSEAEAIYDQMCSLAHGRLTAPELYHIAHSLLLLALSKMQEEERSAELEVLGLSIYDGLDALDTLRRRRKLNGHKPNGAA